MKKRNILPIVIFIITFVLGLLVVITSEQLTQKKVKITQKAHAEEGVCGGAPLECPEQTSTIPQTCPDGQQGSCTTTTQFLLDTSGCPQCYACSHLGPNCTCPPTATPTQTATATPTMTPVATLTPTATSTPTPTPTATPGPSNTPTPTATSTPGPSNTPTPGPSATPTTGPSATPIPVGCGTKSCDNSSNPCRSGMTCVQANDGSNYCSMPEFVNACKSAPSQTSCCTSPATSSTPAPTTVAVKTTEIPSVGVAKFGAIFGVISFGIILLGLLF